MGMNTPAWLEETAHALSISMPRLTYARPRGDVQIDINVYQNHIYNEIIVYVHCMLYCTFTVISNIIIRTCTTITTKCSVLSSDTASYIWQ